jgi:hypothetical protein
MAAARREFEAIAFGAVKDLLNKTGIQPRQIGIIITNSRCEPATRWLLPTMLCSRGQGFRAQSSRAPRQMRVPCSGRARSPVVCMNADAHTVQHCLRVDRTCAGLLTAFFALLPCPCLCVQFVQHHAQSGSHHHESLQDGQQHSQLQHQRDGLQCRWARVVLRAGTCDSLVCWHKTAGCIAMDFSCCLTGMHHPCLLECSVLA